MDAKGLAVISPMALPNKRSKHKINMTQKTSANIELAQKMVDMVKAAGADAADALVNESISLGVSCRMGVLEDTERAESRDIGVRAIIIGEGGKPAQAFVSGSTTDEDGLCRLSSRVVDMARAALPDPYCGLAPKDLLAQNIPALDLADTYEANAQDLLAAAIETEDTARSFEDITNSEGAHASWGKSTTALVNSDGFAAQESGTSFSLSCAVLAGKGQDMQRDYASHRTRYFDDLESPQIIGTRAAMRTIERMRPRKVKSQKAPVFFSTRVAASLLGHFAAAISGATVARGTSFLRDALNTQIMPDHIQIIDDPHLLRGLGSSAFDAEGVATAKLAPVQDGRLTGWFLDSSTAKQLDSTSNGRATRGLGSPPTPAPTNLYMQEGTQSHDDLLAAMDEGFYVTELIGMGVNGVTGDYSRGAAGFWVEGGKIAFPVSEITIAGNLKDMFMNITPAQDLQFRGSINAPSLLIEGMTLAGL